MSTEPVLDLLLVDEEDDLFHRDEILGDTMRHGVPRLSAQADDSLVMNLGGRAARWLEPPKLAVPLLAAQARAAGHSVEAVCQPMLPWKTNAFRRLLLRKPRVAAITTVAVFNPSTLARITREVRALSPDTVIALGGHGAADSPAMRALGDVYISGHGEWALTRLVAALKGGAALDEVPGMAVSAQGRTLAGSLRYEGIPRILYPDWSAASSGSRRYPVEASRGCRFNCSFCGFPGKTSQAFREVSQVVGEMLYARGTRGIRRFEFVDSSLTSDPEFVLALCAALRRENLRADWKCFARPDAFVRSPELAGEMAAAGCSKIFMGVESIHDHILSGMRRGYGRQGVELGLDRVFKAGIKVHGNFIIGFPGETEATVRETAQFIARRPFSSVYLCTFGMSSEMRDLAAADPERYARLRGRPVKGWRHDGMDYLTAYKLTLRAVRKINWTRLWPVAASPLTNNPDNPPY